MGIFTEENLEDKDIHAPPVTGCRCVYCSLTRRRGFSITGHGSYPSHRLDGGKEEHNPENSARLILRRVVSEEQFSDYVAKPGGAVMWSQGPSGLWYASGRPETDTLAGHFIHCYKEKKGEEVAWLCLPLSDGTAPLATIVLAHYLKCTLDEKGAWRESTVSTLKIKLVPPGLEAEIQRTANHYNEWGRSPSAQ